MSASMNATKEVAVPAMKAKFAAVLPPLIATPTKLPTAEPPKIIEAPPPRMAKHLEMRLPEEKLARVRRVVESDIDELVPPTVQIFKSRFPRLEIESFVGYVRSNLYSNSCRIVRTDNAWGIAAVERTFWEPLGWVEVIGVAKLRTTTTEPLAIYLDFRNWAKSLRVAEFRMPQLSGINLDPYAKRLEMTDKMTQYFKVF